jgi:hypothetical protein
MIYAGLNPGSARLVFDVCSLAASGFMPGLLGISLDLHHFFHRAAAEKGRGGAVHGVFPQMGPEE